MSNSNYLPEAKIRKRRQELVTNNYFPLPLEWIEARINKPRQVNCELLLEYCPLSMLETMGQLLVLKSILPNMMRTAGDILPRRYDFRPEGPPNFTTEVMVKEIKRITAHSRYWIGWIWEKSSFLRVWPTCLDVENSLPPLEQPIADLKVSSRNHGKWRAYPRAFQRSIFGRDLWNAPYNGLLWSEISDK